MSEADGITLADHREKLAIAYAANFCPALVHPETCGYLSSQKHPKTTLLNYIYQSNVSIIFTAFVSSLPNS